MKRAHLAYLIAALAVAAPPCWAQELSWTITETFIFEWHGETNGFEPSKQATHDRDHYLALKNRANLGAHHGPLDVQLRFDQSTFWRTCPTMPSDPGAVGLADLQGCRSPRGHLLEDDYRLERATATLRFGRHRLWLGDFPLQIGRGIALSLRKVSEFGIDDALRGGRLRLRLHDAVRVNLFGGLVNISNLDEVTDTHVEETRDRIVGASIEGTILRRAQVGAHMVFLAPQSADGLDQDFLGGGATLVAGGTLELSRLFGHLSIYTEANGLVRTVDEGADQEGFAWYTTVDLDIGRLTLLAELKWYENFVLAGTVTDGQGLPRPLSQPPTVERQDQFIRSMTDVLGGRLRLDARLNDAALLFANFAYVGGRRSNTFDTMHGYAGVEYRLGDGRVSGTVDVGYRREFLGGEGGPDVAELDTEIYQVQASATVGLVGRHGIHLAFNHETWNKPGTADAHYFHRGTVTVGYDYGSTLSLNFAYEYDTQFEYNTYRYTEQGWDYEVQNGVRQHFAFGEVRYTPLDWLDLRLRGGTQRGGLRCMSGVCRVFPNFAGVRFEAVFRR